MFWISELSLAFTNESKFGDKIADTIKFETNFNELEEAEQDLSDFVRVTDDR